MHSTDVTARAAGVRLILLDVDGVLTDGRIWFVPDPDASGQLVEVKAFDASDGAGIAYARKAGLHVGFISGRFSPGVDRRAAELGVEDVRQGVLEKVPMILDLIEKRGIGSVEVCFVGDDIVDLPAMKYVGFPVAVANASDDVKSRAAYVTLNAGGRGAVREVIELILKAQGKWESLIEDELS